MPRLWPRPQPPEGPHWILTSSPSLFRLPEKDSSLGLHTAWPSFGLKMASPPMTMSLSLSISSYWDGPLSESFSSHEILLARMVPQKCSGPSAALHTLLPEDGPTWGRLTPLPTPLGWVSGYNNYCTLRPGLGFKNVSVEMLIPNVLVLGVGPWKVF